MSSQLSAKTNILTGDDCNRHEILLEQTATIDNLETVEDKKDPGLMMDTTKGDLKGKADVVPGTVPPSTPEEDSNMNQFVGMKISPASLLSAVRKNRHSFKVLEEEKKNLLQTSITSKCQLDKANELLMEKSIVADELSKEVSALKGELEMSKLKQDALNTAIVALQSKNSQLLSKVETMDSALTNLNGEFFVLQSEYINVCRLLDEKTVEVQLLKTVIVQLQGIDFDLYEFENSMKSEKMKIATQFQDELNEKTLDVNKLKDEMIEKISKDLPDGRNMLTEKSVESAFQMELKTLEGEATNMKKVSTYRQSIFNAFYWFLFLTFPNFPPPPNTKRNTVTESIEKIKRLLKI